MVRSFTHGIVRLVISFPSERSTKTVRFLDQKWSHFRFFFFPCLFGCCFSSREVQLIVTSSMTRGFWSSSPLISSFSLRSAIDAGVRDYPPQFDRILWEPVDLQMNLKAVSEKHMPQRKVKITWSPKVPLLLRYSFIFSAAVSLNSLNATYQPRL